MGSGPAIGAEFSEFRPPCPTARQGVTAVSAKHFPKVFPKVFREAFGAGLWDSGGIMSRAFRP